MKIDCKYTVWESVDVPSELGKPFLEWLNQLKESYGSKFSLTPSRIHEWLEEQVGVDSDEWETLHDTLVWMTPKENEGYSTIEVVETKRYTGDHDGYHSVITWDNADENKTETQGTVHEEQTTQEEEQGST